MRKTLGGIAACGPLLASALLLAVPASGLLLAFPLCALLLAAPASAGEPGPLAAREPFAKAHVLMMVRAEGKNGDAKMSDVEIWAEGTRLRAVVRGDAASGDFWVDGLASEPLYLVSGKRVEPKRRTMAQGLVVALRPSPDLGNSKNDRVAGHPCKVITQELSGGLTMTRCIWRGLPLSVELTGRGFSFNAAATLVEEGKVAVADLQPPAGAPSAPASLSATR